MDNLTQEAKIVIELNGGLVQNVYSTDGSTLKVLVVDTDIEGAEVTDLVKIGSDRAVQRACVSGLETQPLDSIKVTSEIDTYEGTDQPETCTKCGIRTDFTEMDAIEQYHACPACGYEYILRFDNQ